MAEVNPPWVNEQGDYIYETIERLLPVFHEVCQEQNLITAGFSVILRVSDGLNEGFDFQC